MIKMEQMEYKTMYATLKECKELSKIYISKKVELKKTIKDLEKLLDCKSQKPLSLYADYPENPSSGKVERLKERLALLRRQQSCDLQRMMVEDNRVALKLQEEKAQKQLERETYLEKELEEVKTSLQQILSPSAQKETKKDKKENYKENPQKPQNPQNRQKPQNPQNPQNPQKPQKPKNPQKPKKPAKENTENPQKNTPQASSTPLEEKTKELRRALKGCKRGLQGISNYFAVADGEAVLKKKPKDVVDMDYELPRSPRGFGATDAEGKYSGRTVGGLPQGEGKWVGYFYTYEGGWKNGHLNGAGRVEGIEGVSFEAVWALGVLVKTV